MITENFSFFTGSKNLIIDSKKLKKPNYIDIRPNNNTIILAKNNHWYNFVKNKFNDDNVFHNHVKYKHNIKIDMTDIYILTEKNSIKFFLTYMIDNIGFDWSKFMKMNPKCKGIYLNIKDLDKYFLKMYKKMEKKYPIIQYSIDNLTDKDKIIFNGTLCLKSWMTPCICIWNKLVILDIKFVKKMD